MDTFNPSPDSMNANGPAVGGTSPSESSDDAAGSAKQQVSEAFKSAKDALGDKLHDGVEDITSSANSAADALRDAAKTVKRDHAWMGSALEKSADGLDAVTRSLAGGDLNRIIEDLGGFARRQPQIFLGVTLALGFAVARLGKVAQASEGGQSSIGLGR
jgi:signal transduction histidine kinase